MDATLIVHTSSTDLNYLSVNDSGEKDVKEEKELHPVFDDILNSFQLIYGNHCKNG